MKRVQRKRTKGFRLPENTICVNRGTKWGNPFKVVKEHKEWFVKDLDGNYWGGIYLSKKYAAEKAVELYKGWVCGQIGTGKLNITDLMGKNLACFCPLDSPCHADYLLELANENDIQNFYFKGTEYSYKQSDLKKLLTFKKEL